ncbi:ATP synthase F1 subunit gamma [Halanaerobium congolense]|jgi:F-type H+-transporting ATPase subunit gamma|uniref:ATP synthase gamma chain n=1 Tax=Halanaerobium congolense TaxID=54121 RepID=A0A1G8KJG9_9FIRM|nr:ATP synthase F1 subunit gamma [Halanaerobium congolense]KXS48108.1 MAG: F-type H+-transporting ATPase subunit gamma [Halanaerobium sp. T82-1]PUU93291.1 MAG: F-type H+-transporting ATPase subunit gamma [Halanaerobium sp.]PXV70058.1 ATP synthase F1 subcomplex gamma subunit [Halanaerobium congolense]SDI43522.1 ATP synthase F1 subcomplex gamma subunit [Halanaerobium congolense]SDK57776.1 ATP synthase F1 subcomplex gamma subunit [Halanaerobium congolense]
MQNMRDIQRRIGSVKNTQKITRAMKMVAAAKLKNAQDRAEDARPFFNKTVEVLRGVFTRTREASHPLLAEREGGRHLVIVITGDRGLCGAYNHKVIDIAEEIVEKEKEVSLMVLGRKARDYFRRRETDIMAEYVQLDDYPGYGFANNLADEIIHHFKAEDVNKVSMIYTHFNSAISQTVKTMQLLPVEKFSEAEEDSRAEKEKAEQIDAGTAEEEVKSKKYVDYIFEPSPAEVFDNILPQYLINVIYSALLESKASEFGARMTAMDSATENANEMIDKLTLKYNRARQAEITKEITEIVGGAEALK